MLAHKTKQPDILITVDNGIASVEGVEKGQSTRYASTSYRPSPTRATDCPMPPRLLIPTNLIAAFLAKAMAGVGVIFYLMLALRAELRQRECILRHRKRTEPG